MGSQVDLTLMRNMQGGRGSGQSCGNQYSPFVRTGSVGGPLTTLLSIAAHVCQVKIHPKKHESLLSQHWSSAGFISLQNKRSRTCNCETSQTLWQRVKCVCVLHMACEITGKPIMAALKQLSLSGFLCWVRFLHSVVNGSPYSGAYLVLG